VPQGLTVTGADPGVRGKRTRAATRSRDVRARECSWFTRIAESAVAPGERGFTLRGRAVTAGARRAHQHDVTALEDVPAAVVDRDPVDLDVAEPAVATAREARRRELRALGHERGDDRRVRLALEDDV